MPPIRKNSQSSKPKQRKIPKALAEIPFCHYGMKLDDFTKDNSMQTPIPSPPLAASQSAASIPDTHSTPYYPPDLSANFFHPQDTAHPWYLNSAPYSGTEPYPLPTGGFLPFYVPFQNGVQYDSDTNSHTDGNIPNMANNPCQSYGQYANNHQETSCDPILSGLVNNSLCQHPNIQYPVPQPGMSYLPNVSMAPNALYNHMNSTSTQGSDVSSDETISDNAYFGMQ